MAAALAYRGHWKSLHDPVERGAILQIELDEWSHRERIGEILSEMAAARSVVREARAWLVGRTVGMACHITGWYMPMRVAAMVEARNITEYEIAASFAEQLQLANYSAELRKMGDREKEHEEFFRSAIAARRTRVET
jgi:hypothetical protein